jgi:hypothetical protein
VTSQSLNIEAAPSPKLSDYQKSILEAMNIPVYELLEPKITQDTLSKEQAPELVSIDQSDSLVVEILSVFAAKSTQDLNISWHIHEHDEITLQNNILLTPDVNRLRNPVLKKQLWATLHSLFSAKQWS